MIYIYISTAKTAWHQVKFDIESQARSRSEFAYKLVQEVEKPLVDFKDEQKKIRKDVSIFDIK